jgi:calcineurin-like phosphoesterase family protein
MDPRLRPRSARLPIAVLLLCVGLVSLPGEASGYSSQLLRYPYLTDVVGSSATVNWATDASSDVGYVTWGEAGSELCTAHQVAATRTAIAVNSVPEYQWKASFDVAPDRRYCYRVYLGDPGIDLLDTDASPRFESQVPSGASTPFSFAVFGDWGWVSATGQNPALANLMSKLAASGARFAFTTGDNAYQQGTQSNYGDLVQTGPDLSVVFGPQFWKVPGASLPLFPTVGNHGFEQSADLVNWPQDVAVGGSGGRYVIESHCCLNGTRPDDYPSAWYAFDAGNTRFYVLEAAWSDANPGAGTSYSNDYVYHWTPDSTQYRWLENDLATHPRALKFAFLHFPLYSDSFGDPSDPYLQGPGSLEGLFKRYGVDIAFTGHAHIYERNYSIEGGPVTYVTGGGGAPLLSVGLRGCNPYDAYALGWSSLGVGSACGAAPVPTSSSQVYHFMLVSVNGTVVTVTPINELGQPFDVTTYDFRPQASAGGQSSPAPVTASGRRCGSSRWAVKTLSDAGARKLAARPKRTTVRKLRALRRPRVGRNTPRIGGVETAKYTVRAKLVQMRRAGDREIELVIAQPGSRKRTMAVKFPDVTCRGAIASVHKTEMRAARSALRRACGSAPAKRVRRLRGSAKITGVGFFGVRKGKRYRRAAPNGIELHPVLRFKGVRCKRR